MTSMQGKAISMMIKAVFVVLVAALIWPVGVCAQTGPSTWPPGCESGELDGQLILTCLPENFNGTLIVYAHGYVYPQEELALPIEEIGPENLSVIAQLVGSGFGFATTSYSVNGYAIEEAEADLIALVEHFKACVASPESVDKVVLVGASEGGLVTTMMLEKRPDVFDGGLAMCGPISGMPYQLSYIGDFRVVFDYFFPDVFGFGMSDVEFAEDACDVWESEYLPAVWEAMQSHPLKSLQLFNITGAAFDLFDVTSFGVTAETVLKYTVCGISDLTIKAGGMPYDNRRTWYDASWLLNRKVERVSGDEVALAYVASHYQTTGNLTVPLVTLHNLSDPAVPYRHEEIYKQLVQQKGCSHNLTVWPVFGYGHCAFKPWQVLGALGVLLWEVNH